MSEQKRLLLTVVLATGFLYAWMAWLAPKPQKPAVSPTPSPATARSEATATAAPSPVAVPQPSARRAQPRIQAVVRSGENALWTADFSSAAGVPVRMDLKKFRSTLAKDAPPVRVLPFMGDAPPLMRWNLEVDGRAEVDDGAAYVEREVGPGRVSYERKLGAGITLTKTYSWTDGSYLIEQIVEIRNSSGAPHKIRAETLVATGLSGFKNPSAFNPGDPLQLTAFVNEKAVSLSPSDVAKGKTLPAGNVRWAGFGSRYFLVSLLPSEALWSELQVRPKWKPAAAEQKSENLENIELACLYPVRDLPAGGTLKYVLRMYAGPKDIGVLRGAEATLDRAIDLGDWLGPIARPILSFLRWLHGIFPNYGVAIILLTVAVRLLMFPLAQQQAKSMRRMQEHKPEMDALKEKHANDKETYSRELMSYMRKNKINPMGGCLLLLPQLPVFFALYRVLYNSIELRQAPFALWLRDLSAHDPYFVLPIVLGAVMVIQQKLTPTPGADATQATMMKIMPVMFTFFMLFLPAGLNLYILVSTLWGIGQQLMVQRGMRPIPARK